MRHSYLNLIPETQKSALKRERAFYLVHAVVGILVVALAANSILLVVARFILVAHVNQLKSSTSLVNPAHSAFQREIKDVNKKLEDTAAVQERFVKWTQLLTDASATLPATRWSQTAWARISAGWPLECIGPPTPREP